MMLQNSLSNTILKRLVIEPNIWFASVRANNQGAGDHPHLVPLWFAWHQDQIYLCIQPNSVKARNIARNPNVALSLEDGSNVVICEGKATVVMKPWPEAVRLIFVEKYEWDITTSVEYTMLVKVRPLKWLTW